ncbi:hypothetical protein POM88_003413 [Heracleum sosnowskyi]|uniref:Uncharacterized protein n=1 Tax=Heracleum sosnowskyi TaxID=360622 RepID=A0AAD8JHF2_9APIA|nr:hypothetical protein POM88_003413 [Heracleum sosnowskyi]
MFSVGMDQASETRNEANESQNQDNETQGKKSTVECRLKSKTGNHYDPQLIHSTLQSKNEINFESGLGPTSKKNRTIDINDDIEILGTVEIQSNTLNPVVEENPKKKAKTSPKLTKTTKFEDEMTSALQLMVQTNSGPSLEECKEKLNSLGWGATNPLHRKALGIFCESAKYREHWMLLDADENEHWVKMVSKKIGFDD